MSDTRGMATRMLESLGAGTPGAAEKLLPMVYDELRALAAAHLRDERPGHTLQPTALVHEAYLRLIDITRVPWKDSAHFLAMAAETIRRVLVDHARSRGAVKRGGRGSRAKRDDLQTARRVTLTGADGLASSAGVDLLELDEALSRLTGHDPRQARVVELRFFGGLSVEQTAGLLGVSERTVEGDWRLARAWLRRELAAASEQT